MTDKKNGRLFPTLAAEEIEDSVTVIESYCVNCEKQGETRLLLTRIPFFKDIIISSFSCPLCGYENRHVDTASMLEDEGIRYELRVRNQRDLSRQLVATDASEMQLPGLDSSFPFTQGKLTTIEGAIRDVIENISSTVNLHRESNPELAGKLAEFVGKLIPLLDGETEFDWHLTDLRGSAFVENPFAPEPDEFLKVIHFPRNEEQNARVGIFPEQGAEDNAAAGTGEAQVAEAFDMTDEVVEFSVNCPSCEAPCFNRMKTVEIPHFKEVILMAVTCEACGYRDNEVKPGMGISDLGRKITLHVTDVSDLSRDLLKSEVGSLSIPEFELEAVAGTLGGKFTTVEGILVLMREQLTKTNPFSFGDSSLRPGNQDPLGDKLKKLVAKLDKAIAGELLDYHLILDDCTANSYLQNLYAPDPDPAIVIEDYERTAEQNEDLGIDMMDA